MVKSRTKSRCAKEFSLRMARPTEPVSQNCTAIERETLAQPAYVCRKGQVEDIPMNGRRQKRRARRLTTSLSPSCSPLIRRRFVLGGVQAEAIEFLAHGQAGNAEPPGGFGLIAVSKVDGLPEKLAFEVFDGPGVNAAVFAVLGIGEQFSNVT